MEERARLKALEALFDPTTTARIVALPAGRGRDRSRGVAGQPVRPDDDLGKRWLPPPLVRQYGHQKESDARSQWATLRTTPSSRLSAKRVSRSWYAASAKFARNCNRHVNRKE